MQTHATVRNGVNIDAVLRTRDALAAAPEDARFAWRASTRWINGTHTETSVESFYGFGGEQRHRTAFTLSTDHPTILAAEDNGATPMELVLAGLAGCLTAGIASIAQLREIELNAVTATLEGTMDLRGILGIDREVRNGFDAITVTTISMPRAVGLKSKHWLHNHNDDPPSSTSLRIQRASP